MRPYYDADGVTLYHADCRDVLPELERESIDMIWTDPPYGHSNGDGDLAASRLGVRGARQRPLATIANDGAEEWPALMQAFLDQAARILKRDCCCCCCCGGGGPSPSFARAALWIDERLSFFHAVVWDKSARGHGLGWRFRRDYEFVMVAHRKGGKLAWADDSVAVPNIVRDAPVPNTLHPTTKPIALVQRFVTWHTQPGDTVLDPFAGSGTSLVAAKDLGRRAIGVELDERHCETAALRLSQGVLDFGGVA